MKLIKKIKLCSGGKTLFSFENTTNSPFITRILSADIITGKVIARAVRRNKSDYDDSRIIYDPYYVTNVYGTTWLEPDETDDEHNFRLLPDKPYKEISSKEKEQSNVPIIIPDGTKSIFVEVAPEDAVSIWGQFYESYCIVDNRGFEMSIETFLDDRSSIFEKRLTEIFEKRLTEKMLEMIK